MTLPPLPADDIGTLQPSLLPDSFKKGMSSIARLRAEEDRRSQDTQAIERALRDAHRSLRRAEAVLGGLCEGRYEGCVVPNSMEIPSDACLSSLAALRGLAETIAAQGDAVTRQAHKLAERMALGREQ
jgi:hypothetical protein